MNNINRYRYILFFCGLVFLLSVNLSLRAQVFQSDNENERDTIILKTNKLLPILNNFRFIPSDLVDNPFITSYLKTSIGAGLALDLKAYVKDLDGAPLDTLSGDLAFLLADMRFQLAVNNWLAFNIKYGGLARLGSNAFTLLTSGISYAAGYSLGAKIKIWENEQMMLSGSVEYNSSQVSVYSIYDFLIEVVDSDTIDSSAQDKLLRKDNVSNTFISLNYAYAPTEWCGILAVAGWGVGNIFGEKTRGNARIGVAAAFDFENIKTIGFPIGFLLSAKYNSFSESGERGTNVLIYGFRIGYTGHKDFDVGVESTYQSLNYQGSDEKINALLVALKIRK